MTSDKGMTYCCGDCGAEFANVTLAVLIAHRERCEMAQIGPKDLSARRCRHCGVTDGKHSASCPDSQFPPYLW